MKFILGIMVFLVVMTFAELLVTIVWRGFCLFRKAGSCKFTKCPFRRDFTGTSEMSFFGTGCTKCRPTQEEMKELIDSLKAISKEYTESRTNRT